MSKLKGNKLVEEVNKCRGECNWARLEELLPSIRAKGSGMEKQTSLFEGELELERFIERQNDRVQPNQRHRQHLCTAEGFLKQAIALNVSLVDTVVMEAYLLLAKLHYLLANYTLSLDDIKNSSLDLTKTSFSTLRSLKLAAEGYAVKGFALQHQLQGLPNRQNDNMLTREKMIACFDQAVELALSYVSEFEKSVNSDPRVPNSTPSANHSYSDVFHIGDLLVTAMECAPSISSKRSKMEKRSDQEDNIEKYRHIMTTLSDKSSVEHIQQRLCRQLAEVLLRGSFDSSYSISSGSSPAINQKSEKLNFYTGSNKNYYAPSSRVEEIILVLLISELIASRAVKSSRHQRDQWQQSRSAENLKQVHNLLSVVLSRLRQHSILSLLMERAVQYAGADRYIWRQFGLALACTGRFPRSIKVFEHGIALEQHSEGGRTASAMAWDANERLIEHMQVTKMLLEQQQDPKLAMEHAEKALNFCSSDPLHARCKLLYALAFSQNLRCENSFAKRKVALNESIKNFKEAVGLDPRDDLTHLFCALEYAEARNLTESRSYCSQAIELNPYNPSSTMLMALIFTTKHDYKNALKLVVDAAVDFPNHYGLLVLKLRLEAKFGRVDRALKTSRALLSFWRRSSQTDSGFDDDHQTYHTLHSTNNDTASALGQRHHAENGSTAQRLGSIAMLTTSKDALVPVTPIFTAPLGITASVLPQHGTITSASTLELSEAASNLGHATTTRLSEIGGASTASDSIGFGTSSSLAWSTMNTFRVRANIWVELAEIFLDSEYLSDLTTCVNEAFSLFPNSHQVMYLKGRLALLQAEKLASASTIQSIEARQRYCTEARSNFLAALSINPSHWQSFKYMSRVYRLEGNTKMAEKMLRDAVVVDPLQEDLWQELGQLIAEQNCFEEANECFKTAANIDCTSPLMPFNTIPRTLKSAY